MILLERNLDLRHLLVKVHYVKRPELRDVSFSTRGGIVEVLDLQSQCYIMLENPFGPEWIPVANIIGVQYEEELQ